MSKVMVVDDEKDLLEVVSIILNMNGFEPVLVNSGDDLLNKIDLHRPDLILMDVQLGSYDGRYICKELKAIEKLKHIKVILFSAKHRIEEDYTLFGCDGFIEKPFDLYDLIQKISSHIKPNTQEEDYPG